MNRTEYKNQHIKENYDRINFTIPKGEKDRIKQAASELKMSVNEYLYALVCDDLVSGKSRLGEKLNPEFTEEQQALLDKWQVAQKYRDMIQRMHVDTINGMNKHYTIELKKGYINDVTGSRLIQCAKTAELRRIIVKSHKR